MARAFRRRSTPVFGPVSPREARESELFFRDLMGGHGGRPRPRPASGAARGHRPEVEPRDEVEPYDHHGYGAEAYEDDLVDDHAHHDPAEHAPEGFAGEVVTVDTTAAVPPFPAAEKANVVLPLLTATERASALTWNTTRHSATSGVTMAEIRLALGGYVDFTAVATSLSTPTAPITDRSDDALIEAIHQFQKKCFAEAGQVDGRAGESTLDSLGLIARTGLRSVNRVNSGRTAFLRSKSAAIRRLSGGEFTHATWFDHMVNPSFLGQRFTNGTHLHYVRALRVAERYLRSLPAYANMTPVQLGTALSVNEMHKGARPTATTRSMHTLGLAADMNYVTTPWVVNPDNATGTRDFVDVMSRATALISGFTTRMDAAYLHGLGSGGRTTASVYDELKRRSDDLREYLALAGNRAALTAALATRRAAGTAGTYTSVTSWATQIARDLRTLRKSTGNFGSSRDPRHGFMGHHRDLVIALRDAACMAWGAIDFGPTHSGDVMHFDLRRTGLGQRLNESGYATAVPCPTMPTPAATP